MNLDGIDLDSINLDYSPADGAFRIETTLCDVDHHLARFAALPGFALAEA
jgi:hypothetical protein